MSEYVPFEIQLEIIERLPAKSSVKFRLVSKPWNSYIASSEFIIAHHRRNIHRQPHRLSLLALYNDPPGDIPDGRYVTVFDDDDFYQQDFTPKASLPTKLLKCPKVIDCSLGLVCFYGFYYDPFTRVAILWNPLIRKSVQFVLPSSSAKTNVVGFGVCPVTLDPTLVQISHRGYTHNGPWEVEVFTLSSGTWKSLVSSNLPPKTVILQQYFVGSRQVVIDRFIYWYVCERRIIIIANDAQPWDVNLIVSFDMTTHEFQVIDLPDSLSRPFCKILSKIRESIVVLEYIRDNMTDVCDVWVMEDIVTKSFTKLYTIKAPNPLLKTVLGFRKTGEPIMEAHIVAKKSATIEVYEPRSEHISKLEIYGRSFFVSSYVETLLLHDQADGHIYSYTC